MDCISLTNINSAIDSIDDEIDRVKLRRADAKRQLSKTWRDMASSWRGKKSAFYRALDARRERLEDMVSDEGDAYRKLKLARGHLLDLQKQARREAKSASPEGGEA